MKITEEEIKNEQVTREEFIEEMEKFEKNTARPILEIMEKEEYMLPVAVLGIISIARALIANFGNEALHEEAMHFLQLKINKRKDNFKHDIL